MKILCIDGGGIRGVFPIAILKALENDFNRPVSELFDLIAGTSTGSIIAASVAIEKQMDELLNNYKTYGEKIFTPQSKIGLFKSVYSDRYLRRLLKRAFGNTLLSDITKPLLIPAVDITHGKPYIHRSNFVDKEVSDKSVKLWDAVLSSCSAPVYFPPNNVENKYLSVDGGLWANNPSLVCVTEALHEFGKGLKDIQILSIGTGQQKIDFTIDSEKFWGVRQWLPFHFSSMKVTPKLIDLALNLSSESVSYHCHLLLRENYLRINVELGEEIPFDEVESMNQLIQLGNLTYSKSKAEIKQFLDL